MDVAIAVLLGAVQAVVGFAGVAISLKNWADRARRRFLALFVGLSLLGVAMVTWQAVRAARGSDENKRTLLGDPEHPPFVAIISLPGYTRFVVTNPSDYPAYGIKIRLYDDTCGAQKVVRNYDYPEMAAHVAFVDDEAWMPTDGAIERRFVASITTRTGLVSQEMLLRQTGTNQWMRASRIRNGARTLGEDIDSSWPRNQKGEVKWR